MGPSGPNPAARPLGPGYLPYPRPFFSSPRTVRRIAAAAGVAAVAGAGAVWVQHRAQQERHSRQQHASLAAPPGALTWLLPPLSSSSSQQHPQQQQQQQQEQGKQQPQLLLPQAVADMLCGAIGEMVSVAVLYPLDTIKVRCQAAGVGVGAVVRQLAASRSLPAISSQLYAGVWSASTCSVFIGSLYYYSFCEAKRLATRFVADMEARHRDKAQPHQAGPAGPASSSGSDSDKRQGHSLGVAGLANGWATQQHTQQEGITWAQQEQQQQQQHSSQPHLHSGPAVDYHHDSVLAVICSDNTAAAAAAAAHEHAGEAAHSTGSSAPAAPSHGQLQQAATSTTAALPLQTLQATAAAAAGGGGTQQQQQQQQALVISDQGRAVANLMAAAAAAVVGAVVEAPMELFKHRMQAGQVTGSMFGAMASAWRAGGPAALYWGFLPFLAKSLPYDMGELNSYSSMQDWRDGAKAAAGTQSPSGSSSSSSSSSSGNPVRAVQAGLVAMPDSAWDLLVGAAAGATAVLLSMPTDCIKTVMETGGGVPVAAGGGVRATTAAFLATGRQLVARHGPQGLFIGLVPRLLEQVPSTMLYFGAVGACRRLLAPVTQPQGQQAEAATHVA